MMDKRYATANTSTNFKLLKELIYYKQDGHSVSDMTNSVKAIVAKIISLSFVIDDIISLIYLNSIDPQFDIMVR